MLTRDVNLNTPMAAKVPAIRLSKMHLVRAFQCNKLRTTLASLISKSCDTINITAGHRPVIGQYWCTRRTLQLRVQSADVQCMEAGLLRTTCPYRRCHHSCDHCSRLVPSRQYFNCLQNYVFSTATRLFFKAVTFDLRKPSFLRYANKITVRNYG